MLNSVKEYLNQSLIPLRLSGTTKSGWPFVMSLWYVYLNERIFLATIKTAKIVEYLFNNPKCAFEISSDIPPYCGIRGQATAKIIESKGDEILKILLNRYLGGEDNPLAQKLLNRHVPEVAIELTPVKLYQWDFSKRMQDSIKSPSTKICP
ncbi:MAG: pyridoxamine 5'-phosphate oxidase family protein [Candidatus Hodarchaeota archaeon]